MGPWILAMAIGFEPAGGTLPVQPLDGAACRDVAKVSPVLGKDSPLPPLCAQEFEGSCVSRDGRVRITTSFSGERRTRRTRAGFYGGEGWNQDTFYSGSRTLAIEDIATGRRAQFVEKLRDINGYTAGFGALGYLPDAKAIVLFDVGADKNPRRSYCIRLP